MLELNIVISRYVFFILSAIFIIQGVVYILAQRRAINPHAVIEASVSQRAVILITHVMAFAILWFSSANRDLTLYIAIASFVFIISAFLFVGLIYKNICRLMVNCVLYLCDISLIMLTRLNPYLARRQLVMLAIGFAAFALVPVILKIIPKTDRFSLLYLALGGVLLISPFFIGVTKGGALNWIRISVSSFKIEFQPSEAVKLLFVFYLACVFQKKRRFRELIIPACASMAFMLVLVYQRDLGGALIFFVVFMVMSYIAVDNLLLTFAGLLAFGGACAAAYKMFAHIRVRVTAWRNPWEDITDTGWQIAQALFAIGTWGPFGSGLNRGMPSNIPMAESDFIFSVICEEFGGLFGLCVIGVYIFIFYRGFNISVNAKNQYHGMLAAGITTILCFQTFLILGGNIRLIPLTGVTLPFISHGGSSVVISLLMIGVIEWVAGDSAQAHS